MTNLNVTAYDAATKTWSAEKEEPLYAPNDNLGEVILAAMDKCHDRVMQISYESGIRVTGAEMKIRSIRAAQNLLKMGIGQKDVVGFMARNNPNLAPIVFGCHFIGAPINTLDPLFLDDDVGHMFNLTRPKIIVCENDFVPIMKRVLLRLDLSVPILAFGAKANDGILCAEDLLAATGNENEFKMPVLGLADHTIAAILSSSGTTGLSKGVIVSHGQILWSAAKFSAYGVPADQDIRLCFSSLYWMSGYSTLLFGTIGKMIRVITTTSFSPELFFDIVERLKVKSVISPPSTAVMITSSPEITKRDLSTLTAYMCGGSIVTTTLTQRMAKFLPHCSFGVGYGMTEVVGIASALKYSKAGSVGVLVENLVAKIVDDDGNRLGVGEDGEICILSMVPIMGYYGNEAATKALFDAEGFVCTGDIGHFDDEGFLWVVDRKKDVIKYNNYQITPSEIEEVLNQMDGVLMASVVGIPTDGADLPAAAVIRSPNSQISAAQISEHVASQMADYKKLRGGVYFVEEFPMTPSGKIVKRKVRELVINLSANK